MQLKAEKRQSLGKANKKIRKDNIIPAIIFGKGMESVPVSLGYNEFSKVYEQSGETDLIDVMCEDKKYKVLIKDVQFNPVTDRFLHIGFYKPDLSVKIEAQVPIEVTGEDKNELVKNGIGIALQLLQEITVEALPEDLPHEFKVDVSNLSEFGQGISVSQLEYDKTKVTFPNNAPDELVVRVDEIKVEEEPEEAVSEEEAIAGLEVTEEKAEEETEGGEKKETEPKAAERQDKKEEK